MEKMENPEIDDDQLAAIHLIQGHFSLRGLAEAYAIARFISRACPNPRLSLVGITELLLNAIEHGNLGISYEEKTQLQKDNNWIPEIERRLSLAENQNKYVDVNVERKEKEQELHIRIVDQGSGFDWRQFLEPDEVKDETKQASNQETVKPSRTSTHGRGIPMARGLAFSRLEYFGKGNEVLGVISLV
jgi:hypothetical protein